MAVLPLLAGILLVIVGFLVGFPINILCWIVGGILILFALGFVGGPRTGRRWW